jgi:hypothetical protein
VFQTFPSSSAKPTSLLDTMETTESQSEMESWREAHKTLTEAVIVAKEAVTAAKAQRRYWLEEIAANLTAEGKLTSSSVWKKPTKAKGGLKRKSNLPKASKRKKSDDTETDEEEVPAVKKKKIVRAKTKKTLPKKLKLKLSKPKVVDQDEDDDDMDESQSQSSALEVSGYSAHEQEAAAALLSGASGGDMSHIPEELRAFMAPLDAAASVPELAAPMHYTINPYGGKRLRTDDDDFEEDDDDDEDEEDDDGDEEDE